jgi:hypothetical protein
MKRVTIKWIAVAALQFALNTSHAQYDNVVTKPERPEDIVALKNKSISGSVWSCIFETVSPPNWTGPGYSKPMAYGDRQAAGWTFAPDWGSGPNVPSNVKTVAGWEKYRQIFFNGSAVNNNYDHAEGDHSQYQIKDFVAFHNPEWKQDGDTVTLSSADGSYDVPGDWTAGGKVDIVAHTFSGTFRLQPKIFPGVKAYPLAAGNFSCSFHGYYPKQR